MVYVLSFTFIGIYWNNHHHLLRAARRVTGLVMWANLHRRLPGKRTRPSRCARNQP